VEAGMNRLPFLLEEQENILQVDTIAKNQRERFFLSKNPDSN